VRAASPSLLCWKQARLCCFSDTMVSPAFTVCSLKSSRSSLAALGAIVPLYYCSSEDISCAIHASTWSEHFFFAPVPFPRGRLGSMVLSGSWFDKSLPACLPPLLRPLLPFVVVVDGIDGVDVDSLCIDVLPFIVRGLALLFSSLEG